MLIYDIEWALLLLFPPTVVLFHVFKVWKHVFHIRNNMKEKDNHLRCPSFLPSLEMLFFYLGGLNYEGSYY